MIPGELFPAAGEIELNAGRRQHRARGRQYRRPADPGRHPLPFLRDQPGAGLRPRRGARLRLDIPAGTAVRFEPGQTRKVRLVPYAGARIVHGFRGETEGQV